MTAPQLTPAWFEARKDRVTGSVVGAILGLSPHMTRAAAMRAMVRASLGEPTEFTGNVATEWGKHMEPQAIADYEIETCHKTEEVGFVPFEDWLGASPDRLVGAKGLLEIKCPFGLRKEENPVFKRLDEQPHYYAQIQIELLCTGREWAHFFQWTPYGNRLEMVRPDPDWLDFNLPRLRQFYAEFLDALKDPADYIAPVRAELDTPIAHKMVAEWDELSEQAERVAERKKDLLAEMVKMAGERDALFAGRKLTLTKRQGGVAYAKALKALCPGADVEPYRGAASESWGLR